MKLLGIISVDFDVTGQLLIIYSAFIRYLRKNGNTMRQVHQQSVNSRNPMNSQEEVLYNILIEFGISTKANKKYV